MSIELNKLAAEFNRYFTSSNGVDVPAKVSVSRDEWRALFTAIQQAEAKTDEPVAYMWQHDETGRTGFVEAYQLAMGWRDVNPRLKIVAPCYTHPAPGVPDWAACQRIMEAPEVDEALRLFAEGEATEDQAVAIVQAVLTAAQAQKGQP